MNERLSALLRAHVDDLKSDYSRGQTPEEGKQRLAGEILVDALIASFVETREHFNPSELDWALLIFKDEELLGDLLDEKYSLAALANIGSWVDRTIKLSQLKSKDTPSSQTNAYIKEATRSYIFGFDMASVAMSRAALEQGLKERLGRQGDGNYVDFGNLVEEAHRWNVLGRIGMTAAKTIAKKCNTVLHEKPIQSDEAYQVLVETRSLLEELFSTSGRY